MSSNLLARKPAGSLAEQALVEHQILKHVSRALRESLAWEVPEIGLEKKLATVRFTAQSFQRHLERLLSIEEAGGYLQFVRERRPGLYDKTVALRREHDQFRMALAGIMGVLDELSSAHAERFEAACEELSQLLEQLDRHHAAEVDLYQEATGDVGGEG